MSALLRGATLAIKPEGFEVAHRRGAEVAVTVPVKSNGNGNGNGHRERKVAELKLAVPVGKNGSKRR